MNEELQSTNEELQTINDEARERSDQLGELNGFLESILTSLRSAVAVVDRDLHIRKWSRRAEDLWGLRQDEVLHKNFLNLDIGLPVDRLRAPIRACLARESEFLDVTLDATNRRGRPVQVHVTCTPLATAARPTQARGVILLMEEVAVNAEEFARRLEDMRRHVETIRGTSDVSSAAFEELLVAVEELRVAEEELRQQNEELTAAHASAGRGAPPLPAPVPVRARRLPADRPQRHHPGSQPLGCAPARREAPVPGGEDAGLLRGRRGSRPGSGRELGRWQSEPTAKSLELRLQPRRRRDLRRVLTLSVARGGPRDKAFGFRWLVRDISAQRQLTQDLRLREETARREAEASEAQRAITCRSSRASASWRAASRTTSTTCCMSSWATPTSPGSSLPASRRLASTWTRWCAPPSGRRSSPSSSWPTAAAARSRAGSSICRARCAKWRPCSGRPSPSRPRSSGTSHRTCPPVTADPTQLRQIVMNLITNASDALGEASGTITLRTGGSRSR